MSNDNAFEDAVREYLAGALRALERADATAAGGSIKAHGHAAGLPAGIVVDGTVESCYFSPSTFPLDSRRIASARRLSFVSSRLADSIQA